MLWEQTLLACLTRHQSQSWHNRRLVHPLRNKISHNKNSPYKSSLRHRWNQTSGQVRLRNSAISVNVTMDLTKLRRRRQRERQKSNRFNKQNNNFACVSYISLPSLHNYDETWPNFTFTWEQEREGYKFWHLCLNSGAVPSLQLQHKFPSFLYLGDLV